MAKALIKRKPLDSELLFATVAVHPNSALEKKFSLVLGLHPEIENRLYSVAAIGKRLPSAFQHEALEIRLPAAVALVYDDDSPVLAPVRQHLHAMAANSCGKKGVDVYALVELSECVKNVVFELRGAVVAACPEIRGCDMQPLPEANGWSLCKQVILMRAKEHGDIARLLMQLPLYDSGGVRVK